MRKRSVSALAAAVVACGCVGTGTMRSLAPDAGVEVRYAVPADTVLAALPSALHGRGLRVAVHESFDSATRMVIATKGANLVTWGTLVRVLVRPSVAGDHSTARFLARSSFALDHSGRVDRVTPRAIAALDRILGPAAVGPFPGMTVRGRSVTESRSLVRGTVIAGTDGVLRVQPDGSAAGGPVPLATLRDLMVLRGTFGHRSEGATVGSLVGMVAGTIIGAATSDGPDRRNAALTGMLIGGTGGLLTGMLVGSAIRTDVWSPAGPTR
jgi:hypothetical protein